jgi:UDP-N-acetylglucosamine/UDP-N-acetylgalactosamine diphosphorylase
VSGKTLFAIHCAKVRALETRYGGVLPLLVMVSEATDGPTRRYFELHEDDFGLGEIRFAVQGMLPAVDAEGKLFLAARDRVHMSPDGHGGAIGALAAGGLLEELLERGFTDLFYFQVDNPLVKVAEPFFLGAHALAGSEYSLKVLRKRSPREKLGVLARHGDRHLIVEYIDLPRELAEARDADGNLLFWAGSPAIHVFSLAFLKRLADGTRALPYHEAHKKIPHVDAAGDRVEPSSPNGIKFETFIFDAIPHAERILAVEGVREEEFAPVKNKTGEDSVESSRRMLVDLHWRWLAGRGVRPPLDEGGGPLHPCEVHPSFALGPGDLPADIADRVAPDGPVYLE